MGVRRSNLLALTIIAVLSGASVAAAQTYPSRPITIVVPFPAGGSIDTVARVVGERMKVALGEPVIVENVTGAGGSVGAGRVAHAAPDGYTIGVGNLSTHVINGATYALDYDVAKDFEPISLLTSEPMVAGARKTMEATELAGLVTWLTANPDRASAAVGGTGDITQIADLLFQQKTGTHFQLIPYRGTVLALNDVTSGRVDLVFMQASSLLPQISAGNIKAYAVMGPKRLASDIAIPTVDEAGLPGFYVPYWFGMWAPKGTSKAIISKLNHAVVEALADNTVRGPLNELGREIVPNDQQTPEGLAALQRSEIEKWWPIIKAAGIKAQ
jgi:tripartite-type tricarboxylate transporter receptor subunit TctC